MAQEYYLSYRGEVKACLGIAGTLAFVTVHPENQSTGLYRLDCEKLLMSTTALPVGGVALTADGETVWVAGSDRRLYVCPPHGGPSARGGEFAEPLIDLAFVVEDCVAVLTGSRVCILSRKDGKQLQVLELPEAGTAMAVDRTGHWLVVGTGKGNVAVFESEGKSQFALSEIEKLHDGPVTALLFEADELRFFSAGADLKLLSTYARGRLEAEDRGRANNHGEPITALIRGPADRFLTGSRDSTVKAWPKGQGARPFTQKDGIARVIDLTIVTVHNKPHLIVACADNSFRLLTLNDEGKPDELIWRIDDAVAGIKAELAQPDPKRREAALKTLAGYADTASIELIAEQSNNDPDNAIRQRAAELLAESQHPRAGKLLERGISHRDEAVRVVSFRGLRRHLGASDLRPLDLAIKTGKPDVGKLAVEALEPLAAQDDQALDRLVKALDAPTLEVRRAALAALEKVYGDDSPDANLEAFASQHADVRRLSLVRLYHRKMLGDSRVQAALRRRCEDGDAEVRRIAFLLTLYPHPNLVAALRERDPELQRQLVELEHTQTDGTPGTIPETKSTAKDAAKKPNLSASDFDPLLQATANQSLDTCLRGARGLAVLHDPRAFGLLLQLSREPDRQARVDVCRAMAALDDPRAVNRLRSLLYDGEASVRDAAFSALAQIHKVDPLLSAEAGLNAPFEDVRKRGLHVLVEAVRQSAKKQPSPPARVLLLRALNDGFAPVRGETAKAVMNLKIDGGESATLRFLLQSIHPDIRLEALTETMAQSKEAWAWELLLEFFNDPEPMLRTEAFEFAVKKSKELDVLQSALRSRYADSRMRAVEGLIKKHSKAAQAILVQALADEESAVRLQAVAALIDDDARAALSVALDSPHNDVRVRAASALARHGDEAALPVLTTLANLPRPHEEERHKDWAALVEAAVEGLGELGNVGALAGVVPMLDRKRPTTRLAAARAMIGLATPATLESFRPALQSADPQVKYRLALGLAIGGDNQAAPIVFSKDAEAVLTADEQLIAALALGPAAEDQLVSFLDHADEGVRSRALLVELLLEMVDSRGVPGRCLACLSSKMPRVRLAAALGLEAFADPTAFAAFVAQRFNDRGEAQPFKITDEVVRSVALLLAFGASQTKARTARLLSHLAVSEQSAWNQAWKAHADRYAQEIAALNRRVAQSVETQYSADQLRQLAFGAYIGLIREQASGSQTPQVVARVRQTALSRVLALAQTDGNYVGAAKPVFIQALGDPNQPVRTQAFEQLQALNMDSAALGEEAIASGHLDLGVRGLKLLTDGASAKEGDKVLEQVMLTRADNIAVEAAKLLVERRTKIAVAEKALGAVYEPLRLEAVQWLAQEYERDAVAQKALRGALESRYQKIRESAAVELGGKKDPKAFDALVKLLNGALDGGIQRRAIDALVALGDPRAPTAFLDRLENDPAGTAPADVLFASTANFRQADSVARLFALGEKRNNWSEAYNAVYIISGYDQPIEDSEEESADRTWEKEQHPRRDAVLARLMEHALSRADAKRLTTWITDARWARGKEVEPILALLVNHADAELRNAAVQAIGWRLRKRKADAEPLLKSLRHKDPTTQFIAAEGLARGGRAEGINVLLSAVEYLEDDDMRERAVIALGELGDRRAFDVLLKLAAETDNDLQESAAEALGHLGKSPHAEEIFQLLQRLAKDNDDVAVRALTGLRWLNTQAGWQIIRQRAADSDWWYRDSAVELLGYNDDPATRDLLLKLLSTPDCDFLSGAMTAARRLWGAESLEPDYALLRSGDEPQGPIQNEALKRICERGEPGRIFEILPACHEDVQNELAASLLNRPALPAAQLQAALTGPNARSVQLAAHLLGRHAEPPRDAAKAVEVALAKWTATWNERRIAMLRQNRRVDENLNAVTPCLETLLWTGSRVGIAMEALRKIVEANPDDPLYRPIRLSAVSALTQGKIAGDGVTLLERTATGNDAEARTLAVETLARQQPKRAAALAEKLLTDRVGFDRLASLDVPIDAVLRSAVNQVHYQGVALPHLIRRKDFDGLLTVIDNTKLPDVTRLGAVEGLAMLGEERAEAKLVELGKNEKEHEDVRKAAWKGLKRSRRARKIHNT